MSNNAITYIKNNFDYADIARQYLDVIEREYNKFFSKRGTK
jgi:hypothetical protein